MRFPSRRIVLAALACLAFPSGFVHAVPLANDSLDDFIKKSQKNPKKLFLLKMSAEWCGPCKTEAKALKGYSQSEKDAINRAYWSELDVDKVPSDKLNEFIKKMGLSYSGAIPFNIAFKKGVPIGSVTGFSMEGLKNFVSDAEAYDPGSDLAKGKVAAYPKLPCGPKDIGQSCVVGISGMGGRSDEGTDDFGRANLKTFSDLFASKEYEKLFAPKIPPNSPQKAPHGDGVLFVRNPFLSMADSFSDSAVAEASVGKVHQAPGKNLRLMLTGHGLQEGLVVGKERVENKEMNYSYDNEIIFRAEALNRALIEARRAGKSVRGVVTQCYGGQYGDAFMPVDGEGASGCAVFSSLPEKESEGCYSSEFKGERSDYIGNAIKLKKCNRQTSRELHYEIVAQSKGHDVPMLSSEYFLMYGPGAKFLAMTPRVRARPQFVHEAKLKSGAVVLVDQINLKPLKATYQGREISLPQMDLVNCRSEQWPEWDSPDNSHRALFFLKHRSVGSEPPLVGDCLPTFKFSWFNEKLGLPSETHKLKWNSQPDANSLLGITQDISGLKIEAKMFFARIFPYLDKYYKESDRQQFIEATAKAIGPYDAAQARAILELYKAVAEIEKEKKYPQPLMPYFLRNQSEDEYGADQIPMARLTHVLASAIAELELRKEAESDPEAAKLLRQLEDMKKCETDLL